MLTAQFKRISLIRELYRNLKFQKRCKKPTLTPKNFGEKVRQILIRRNSEPAKKIFLAENFCF